MNLLIQAAECPSAACFFVDVSNLHTGVTAVNGDAEAGQVL